MGDIHGCSVELRELLALLDERRVVSLGDVLDRGPDPEGCLRLLRDRDAEVVLGNHEEKHLRFRRHHAKAPERPNPVQLAPHHHDTQRAVSEDSWRWLEQRVRPFLELGPHGALAVHAGLAAGVAPEDHAPERICRVQLTKPGARGASPWGDWRLGPQNRPALHGRDVERALADGYRWWTEYLEPGTVVVYGHSVVPRPFATHRREGSVQHSFVEGEAVDRSALVALGIDTGAPFGGALTALLLPEWRCVQVAAKARYFRGRVDD